MIEKLQNLINTFNELTAEQKEELLTIFRRMVDEIQDEEVNTIVQDFLHILEDEVINEKKIV